MLSSQSEKQRLRLEEEIEAVRCEEGRLKERLQGQQEVNIRGVQGGWLSKNSVS